MKRSIGSGVLSVVFLAIIAGGYCHAIEREQASAPMAAGSGDYDFVAIATPPTADESQLDAERPKKKPSFWRYVRRIAVAPVMVLVRFPKDEETDIYQTYLTHVNKGTDRQWKRDKFNAITHKDYSSDDTTSANKQPGPASGGEIDGTASQSSPDGTSGDPSAHTS